MWVQFPTPPDLRNVLYCVNSEYIVHSHSTKKENNMFTCKTNTRCKVLFKQKMKKNDLTGFVKIFYVYIVYYLGFSFFFISHPVNF